MQTRTEAFTKLSKCDYLKPKFYFSSSQQRLYKRVDWNCSICPQHCLTFSASIIIFILNDFFLFCYCRYRKGLKEFSTIILRWKIRNPSYRIFQIFNRKISISKASLKRRIVLWWKEPLKKKKEGKQSWLMEWKSLSLYKVNPKSSESPSSVERREDLSLNEEICWTK